MALALGIVLVTDLRVQMPAFKQFVMYRTGWKGDFVPLLIYYCMTLLYQVSMLCIFTAGTALLRFFKHSQRSRLIGYGGYVDDILLVAIMAFDVSNSIIRIRVCIL